jgi:hypothetical protein
VDSVHLTTATRRPSLRRRRAHTRAELRVVGCPTCVQHASPPLRTPRRTPLNHDLRRCVRAALREPSWARTKMTTRTQPWHGRLRRRSARARACAGLAPRARAITPGSGSRASRQPHLPQSVVAASCTVASVVGAQLHDAQLTLRLGPGFRTAGKNAGTRRDSDQPALLRSRPPLRHALPPPGISLRRRDAGAASHVAHNARVGWRRPQALFCMHGRRRSRVSCYVCALRRLQA